MGMGTVGGIAAGVVGCGVIGAGVTALATRDSSSGEGALDTAKGLGIAAGVTGAVGVAGLAAVAAAKGGIVDDILNMVLIGIPSVALTGVGAGLTGAAVGTALVGAARN